MKNVTQQNNNLLLEGDLFKEKKDRTEKQKKQTSKCVASRAIMTQIQLEGFFINWKCSSFILRPNFVDDLNIRLSPN